MNPFASRATPLAPPYVDRRRVAVPWVLFGCAFLTQTAFPFTDGGTRALTTASVLLLTAAAVAHVVTSRGTRPAVILVVVAGGGGLLAETVGVHTGFPFGTYEYTGSLGLQVFGVPALVPLAWTMMAWPALAAARQLVGAHREVTPLVGAWALTAWDVFLDPQMVDQGHWRWAYPQPALPGVEGIPLTNFAGWFVVSAIMITLLDRLIPAAPEHPSDADSWGGATDLLPVAVYLWTYLSSVIAHAAFFGRPPVALVGGLVMGVVAVPLAVTVMRGATRAQR
ncbi:carotenoid biosynthesis protein [Gordonia sp. Z-3]|uniref:carotenoid biosynthesis protein n=1 Tax=Gordonia sp. Z-3 TaxID=3115408 RepID=UPI002E291CCC|nr:carotenoid biosynthesis protein [Gordonia sp. Z-3]MED5803319.1 carotenoid biosynthesis protein [Gordonia sp. Z-3]